MFILCVRQKLLELFSQSQQSLYTHKSLHFLIMRMAYVLLYFLKEAALFETATNLTENLNNSYWYLF